MSPEHLSRRRYRCRFCGAVLPAAKRPDVVMLLGHLSQRHPDQVGPYLERMRIEDIATVAAEGYEMVKEDETR